MKVEIRGGVFDLTADEIAELREQLGVVERVTDDELIGTAEAARRLGVSADFVREHAAELGGTKLTAGPKAPWRFDPAKLARSGDSPARESLPVVTTRRRVPRRSGSGQLLQSRGRQA